jgi:hypothetical protein
MNQKKWLGFGVAGLGVLTVFCFCFMLFRPSSRDLSEANEQHVVKEKIEERPEYSLEPEFVKTDEEAVEDDSSLESQTQEEVELSGVAEEDESLSSEEIVTDSKVDRNGLAEVVENSGGATDGVQSQSDSLPKNLHSADVAGQNSSSKPVGDTEPEVSEDFVNAGDKSFKSPPSKDTFVNSKSDGDAPLNPISKASPMSTVDRARLASVPTTESMFNQGSGATLACAAGTVLTVEPNVFEYADGRPLKPETEVVLEILEFYELYDVIMAGLTTHGPDGLLETGGMLYLGATASGEPLRIKQGKGIGVKFASDQEVATAEMELYHGVDRENVLEWVKAALPKPISTIPVKGALKPRAGGSIVLLDGILEGELLGNGGTLHRNRKLDHGKLSGGIETLEGTAQVWGKVEEKAIGGKVVFSNGVRLYQFPNSNDQRFERDLETTPSIRIKGFHDTAGVEVKPADWFGMKKQRASSTLLFKHRLRTGGFICKTPALRNDSSVRTEFPWGKVQVPPGLETTFFVKYAVTGSDPSASEPFPFPGCGFSVDIGCLKGKVKVNGQLGSHRNVTLSNGEAISLELPSASTNQVSSRNKGGLDSKYNPWEFKLRNYPNSSKLMGVEKSLTDDALAAVRKEVNSKSSLDEYYKALSEEEMKRVERQFKVVKLGWKNLDKPGLRDTAAKVKVDCSGPAGIEGKQSPPIIRAVYRKENSCTLIDSDRFVPSGDAMLVGVSYHPQTLRPSLDFKKISIRPGENSFSINLGEKTTDELRRALDGWRGEE